MLVANDMPDDMRPGGAGAAVYDAPLGHRQRRSLHHVSMGGRTGRGALLGYAPARGSKDSDGTGADLQGAARPILRQSQYRVRAEGTGCGLSELQNYSTAGRAVLL